MSIIASFIHEVAVKKNISKDIPLLYIFCLYFDVKKLIYIFFNKGPVRALYLTMGILYIFKIVINYNYGQLDLTIAFDKQKNCIRIFEFIEHRTN